ncbi:winged helix-turn-helix domain-containing protein [Pseudarthrobacter sp. R1]|uniref:winged helix-turn-helix domain-containing protein n=1 Tax=Pseudarthrobacter sp. R1 TaxID=2944934 RepID=UPI0035A93C0C
MTLTSQETLKARILLILHSSENGSLRRSEVLMRLRAAYKDRWTAEDEMAPKSRPFETNWANRASFARADLVRDGLLRERTSGTWALTDRGWTEASLLAEE